MVWSYQLIARQQTIFNKGENMSVFDIFKASSIKNENEKLHSLIKEIGAQDAITVKNKILEYENIKNNLHNECETLKSENELIEKQILEKRKEIIVLDEEILLESFALYKPKFNKNDTVKPEIWTKKVTEQ